MTGTQQSFGFDTTHGFLGEEFLLWLWYRLDTEGGEFTLPGGQIVGVAIDDLLVFAPQHDDDTQQTLRNGTPTRTAEARVGLRQGHRIARARLIVGCGQREWTVTIDGERMAFAGCRLPDDDEGCESAIDRTTDRVSNWLELHRIVAGIYAQFLALRTAAKWQKKEAPAIAAWMRG